MSRYTGWDRDEMRALGTSQVGAGSTGSERAGKKRKTQHDSHQPSGFTPINRPTSPPHTEATFTSDDTPAAPMVSHDTKNQSHRRNPVLKEYLGPGKSTLVGQVSMFERAAFMHGEELPQNARPKRKPATGGVPKKSSAAANEPTVKQSLSLERTVSDGMRQSKPGVGAHSTRLSKPAPKDAQKVMVTSESQTPDETSLSSGISERTMSKLDAFRFQQTPTLVDSHKIPIISPVTSLDLLSSQQPFSSSSTPSLHSVSWDKAKLRETKWGISGAEHDNVNVQYRGNSSSALHHIKSRAPALAKSESFSGPSNQTLGLETIVEEPERECAHHEKLWLKSPRHADEHTCYRPLSPTYSLPETTPAGHFDPSKGDDFDEFSDGLVEEDFLLLPSHDCANTSKSGTDPPQLPTPLHSDAGPLCRPSISYHHQSDQTTHSRANTNAANDANWEMIHDSDDIPFPHLLNAGGKGGSTLGKATAYKPTRDSSRAPSRQDNTKDSLLTKATDPTKNANIKPFVRPPFPKAVRDRSPVIGLSVDPSLRVCFRVGEALNVGSKAVRENRAVLIELYARVRTSSREANGVKQHFEFQDLFHDHPPYLQAAYDIWKGVALWDYDSSRFLQPADPPRMCRCIGKMKREGTTWKLLVLNIWEASWDDINAVKGIVAA